MPVGAKPSVVSALVEPFEGEDDEADRGWVHPDDRLWRHPSELISGPSEGAGAAGPSPARAKTPNVFAIAGLAGVIGALMTAGLIAAIGGFNGNLRPVRSIEKVASPTVLRTSGTAGSNTIVSVAQRLRPAIVEVRATTAGGSKVSGSGVAFRTDGHILTNRHVVDGASNVTVIASDGRSLTARIIGTDADTDVAVLKVDADMAVATLGAVGGLQVGEQAIAIGSPLGLSGGPSVTVGVVSALGRRVDSDTGPPLVDMIQTDAPISPGSSGGALVDSDGNVIGITTAIAVSEVGAEGLGFATPIDIARDVAEQLLSTGHVVHVWLGVRGEDLELSMAKSLGLSGGALVSEVAKGSPADVAGLHPRDIITTVNGKPVSGIADVIVSVRTRKVGDQVKVIVWREGRPHSFHVILKERSA